jgi:DNA-binding CsgD family transcriptional regulator
VFKFNQTIQYQGNELPLFFTLVAFQMHGKKLIFVYCVEATTQVGQHSSEVSNVLNNAIYNASFDVLFTLHLSYDNHLLLLNYNKTFLTYFRKAGEHYEYYDLSTILPPSVVSFFSENTKLAISQGIAFSRLLDYDYTLEDRKTYLTPKKNKITLLTTFLPLNIQEYRSVLCCSRDITSEMEAKNQTNNLLEEYNALFTATANAVAVFSCTDPYHPVLERQNARMDELTNLLGTDNYSKIFQSSLWIRVLETRQSVEDMLTLLHNSQKLHYKIIAIPILRNGILVKAIISIIDTTEQVVLNIRNFIKLTNREEEVISYVIAGEKNDFIATKLCVSVGTIKRTLSNAYSKLGISSRVELLNYYHSLSIDTIRQDLKR